MTDGHSSHREGEIPGESSFRVRRSDVAASLGLAGLLGVLTLFWQITSGIQEALRMEIRNAENRITNRIQTNEQWLRECCGRRR